MPRYTFRVQVFLYFEVTGEDRADALRKAKRVTEFFDHHDLDVPGVYAPTVECPAAEDKDIIDVEDAA